MPFPVIYGFLFSILYSEPLGGRDGIERVFPEAAGAGNEPDAQSG
jgi:hypothetical protein